MRQYTTLQSDYVVPASSYILYPEGEHCTNAEPGDIILDTIVLLLRLLGLVKNTIIGANAYLVKKNI